MGTTAHEGRSKYLLLNRHRAASNSAFRSTPHPRACTPSPPSPSSAVVRPESSSSAVRTTQFPPTRTAPCNLLPAPYNRRPPMDPTGGRDGKRRGGTVGVATGASFCSSPNLPAPESWFPRCSSLRSRFLRPFGRAMSETAPGATGEALPNTPLEFTRHCVYHYLLIR